MKTFKQWIMESKDDDHYTIHRGESVHNKKGGPGGGKYYSTDREFAKQFTQSGQDHEVHTRRIEKKHVMDKSHVYAGDDIEPHIKEAKKKGYKAVKFNEGEGQPHSIYVLDHKALKK
jgi:hypothetical protein